jgi:peptidoglycan DL-endopeptidase CwlO
MTGFSDVVSRIGQIKTLLGLAPAGDASAGAAATSASAGFGAELSGALDPAAGSTAGSLTGAAVVADAQRYLGVPYVFGGTDPTTGLDCSGLVQRVYADLGVTVPRVAADQATAGRPVGSLTQAQPGDLLAFDQPVDHIAIYLGDGKMIAAPQPGDHVKIQNVYRTPTAIRRIVPDAATAPASALLRPASLLGAGTAVGSVPFGNLFAGAAARHGVSAELLAAVAKVESNYNPRAVSPAGAQGLMQIMPSTAAGLGINPLDPAQAIDGAARILAGNLREFGSLPLAVAAYNAGSGAVRRHGGIPPFAQTQAYVPKVLSAMAALSWSPR